MAKKLDEKQFLLILIAWLVIAYIIMWLFGGACTSLFVEPAKESAVCLTSSSLAGLRSIPIIGFFIPYNNWVSLMYWMAPLAGFVLAYFGIKWFNDNFETNQATSIIFPVALIIILLLGFLINLSWYYGETAALNSNSQVSVSIYFCFNNDSSVCNNTVNSLNTELQNQASTSGATRLVQYLQVNYWEKLRQSFFLTFILGAITGWVPLFVRRLIEDREEKSEN